MLERAGVGAPLTDDVERRAVRRSREYGFQTRGDRHALVEAEEFGRDLPLVVIHHHHAVVFALERLQEKSRLRAPGPYS